MPRHPSFLLKLSYSTYLSLPLPLSLSLSLWLVKRVRESVKERERERKSERITHADCWLLTDWLTECGCAHHGQTYPCKHKACPHSKHAHTLSVPHSVSQSVNMRGYYINCQLTIFISDTCNINTTYEHKWCIKDHNWQLQIVTSLTDNSRGIIYDHNMLIIQAAGSNFPFIFAIFSVFMVKTHTCQDKSREMPFEAKIYFYVQNCVFL